MLSIFDISIVAVVIQYSASMFSRIQMLSLSILDQYIKEDALKTRPEKTIENMLSHEIIIYSNQ